MKKLLILSLALSGAAFAQTAAQKSVNGIISQVEAAQKNLKDVSFKVSGSASFDSGAQKLDLDVQAIPAQNLARVNFNAPDALADNVVVVDNKTVSNYLYLTNQITVQNASQAAQAGVNFFDPSQFTNFTQLLNDNYNVKLVDTVNQGGKVYVLEATPKNGGGERTRVWIAEQGWRPVRVQVLSGGKVATDLNITDYKTNSGLSAARLKALPKDAEVVRR